MRRTYLFGAAMKFAWLGMFVDDGQEGVHIQTIRAGLIRVTLALILKSGYLLFVTFREI